MNKEQIIQQIAIKKLEERAKEYQDSLYKFLLYYREKEKKIKLDEKQDSAGFKSVLKGVPNSMPSLVKAIRIQDKVQAVGFDWDNKEQVFEKVKEEFSELHKEVEKNDVSAIEDEFGDVLFSMINYARFIGVDPEMALERTNKKFIKRFQYLEAEPKKDGKEMGEMTLDEMDEYWNKAKKL